MSSTNKTANYELSQFVGTDIPSILGDYNGDMRKIDAAIGEVASDAGSTASSVSALSGRVTNAENNIQTLEGAQTVTNQRSVQNQTAITNIEGKIPATASTENKLATASEVSAVSGDVDDIKAVIPNTASASNKLATMSDIGSGHEILYQSTDNSKTYGQVLDELFNTVLKPIIEAEDYAKLFNIRIRVPGYLISDMKYEGVLSTLSSTSAGEWDFYHTFINTSGQYEGVNVQFFRFQPKSEGSVASEQITNYKGTTATEGSTEYITNTNIPRTGIFVYI